MSITPDDILALLKAFDAGAWQEMSITSGTGRVQVSRRVSPAKPQTPAVHPMNGVIPSPAASPTSPVIAPSVGVFRRALSTGESPLVAVGATVGPDDAVGLVEVMDAVRYVLAGVRGTVTDVFVEDGAVVEYGEPLMLVREEEGEHGHGPG